MQPKSILLNQISVNRGHNQKGKLNNPFFYEVLKNRLNNSIFGKFVNTATFAENLR